MIGCVTRIDEGRLVYCVVGRHVERIQITAIVSIGHAIQILAQVVDVGNES